MAKAGMSVSELGRPEDLSGTITVAMTPPLLFRKEPGGPPTPGPAFSFLKALMGVNVKLKEKDPKGHEAFRVLLVERNASPWIEKAIKTYDLGGIITRLTVSDEQLLEVLQKNNTHLYLLDDPSMNVQKIVCYGIAAAIVFPPKENVDVSEEQLRLAFDDSVIFTNEYGQDFHDERVEGFLAHEEENAEVPLNPGPFKRFLEVLENLKKRLQDFGLSENCPVRTYLVTSRGAGGDGYRALKTLRGWGFKMDEAVFLGGSLKGPVLEKIKPHIFFDDQMVHVNGALQVGVVAGWVYLDQ